MTPVIILRWKIVAAFLANVIAIAVVSGLLTSEIHKNTRNTRELQVQRASLQRQVAINNATTKAVCALRADYRRRVQTTNDFLKEHPEGFAGISAAILKRSNKSAQDTVDSLAGLKCVHQGGK
jgi:uncharacterized membrane protein YraQ (UPF0718 family)